MTVIVTGGAGFIGSNFIFYWTKIHPQDRVVCLDALTYAGNLATLEPLRTHPGFRFVKGDICDRETVFRLFEEVRPDCVIHFAAESHVDRSISDPSVFLRTNVTGTGVLLDACLAFGVSRFHQVSTDEVYGDFPLDSKDRFTESSPLRPSSPYSASKAAADLLVLSYVRTYGLNATVSRCSNNYGPYQFPEKLIPLMCIHALTGKPLPLYGDGRNIRDWLHVEDHCRALERILLQGCGGEVYNVGGGTELENRRIVSRICRILEVPETQIVSVADRKGHDLRYAVDSAKLSSQLGWTPQVPFEEGLCRTVQWYRDREDWWQMILSGEYRRKESFYET